MLKEEHSHSCTHLHPFFPEQPQPTSCTDCPVQNMNQETVFKEKQSFITRLSPGPNTTLLARWSQTSSLAPGDHYELNPPAVVLRENESLHRQRMVVSALRPPPSGRFCFFQPGLWTACGTLCPIQQPLILGLHGPWEGPGLDEEAAPHPQRAGLHTNTYC